MRRLGTALTCALAMMSLIGCGTKTVMTPQISPDAQVHAVLEQTMYGGAAGGTDWALYLSNASGGERHRNFEGHDCNGIAVAWVDSTLLRVDYPPTCHIETFDNVWLADPHSLSSKRIEIVLARQ
jgi:hypothetical protein